MIRPTNATVELDASAQSESLADAWTQWKTTGGNFWRRMDDVTAMLDGLAAQEARDA